MSQFLKTREEVEAWLDEVGIGASAVEIDENLVVSSKHDVRLRSMNLDTLPVQFGKVGGTFNCSANNLTSLEGCPTEVEGWFICSQNQLTSLAHGPRTVFGNYNCAANKLTSLEGAPRVAGAAFHCEANLLESLAGAPAYVSGSFLCQRNRLTSLEGAPEHIFKNFESDFSVINLRAMLKTYMAAGGKMEAANISAMCRELESEIACEQMKSAITDTAPTVPARRKQQRL